ncbi:MAG: MarR family transcriptional regulator [Actinomycetota bacterium]|nr:MarR family transcriptional regulator [Actinomycetota bacterium]
MKRVVTEHSADPALGDTRQHRGGDAAVRRVSAGRGTALFHETSILPRVLKLASSAHIRKTEYSEQPPPERETDVLRRTLSLLGARLPGDWGVVIEEDVQLDGASVDAVVTLSAPDGTEALLVVEAKRLIAPRDLPVVLDKLSRLGGWSAGERAIPMVVARYLAPSTRERLEADGAAYADATGNLRVVTDRPALFLRDAGADRDPWRGPGRPRGTLKGPPAARVVRALVDFSAPMTVPELVRRSGASTGATYRVVDFLEREALIEREPRGPIVTVEWRRLLERWSEDYGFQRSNTVRGYLQPRGIRALTEELQSASDLPYVLTGSLAAERLAPYAPPRLATVYVDDLDRAAERLNLRSVESGANVLLAAGDYDVVFERSVEIEGLTFASPSQVAVDLLTGPGRGPSEGEALLDWMQTHECAWKS